MRPEGLRRYTDYDYELIAEWYAARGETIPPKASLSDMGWICDERVAGWLYVTPSNVALIEGIVSNPDTVPSLRSESMRKLAGFIIDTALLMGYTQLLAITEHPSVMKACEEFGFREQSYRVFTLSDTYNEKS